MTGTILDRIVETKRREVEAAKRRMPLDALKGIAAEIETPRGFYSAVVDGTAAARLIAEVKQASPSAGQIRADFDPVAIARVYASAGAAALSVLTDRRYFQGDLSFIAAIKREVVLPVLRKDFTIDAYQLYESRAAGADAILLIAEILSPGQIDAWSRLSFELGMASLIEIHDRAQLEAVGEFACPDRRALLAINNRDLHAQRIDLRTTLALAKRLPAGTPFVAESGIQTRDDVLSLQGAGATALLIGEALMRAGDPAARIGVLFGD